MRRWIAVVALTGCSAQPAHHAPAPPQTPSTLIVSCMRTAQHRDAMEACRSVATQVCAAEQTVSRQIECYNNEANAWQLLLDETLQRLELSEPTRNEALSRVNETWPVWRDAECGFQESARAGGAIEAACISELTADRAIELIAARGLITRAPA